VTAFPNQKQYTGYVHLPPFTLTPYQQNYSINTFFWFVEARTSPETAPLTIWLNGGPGASSMIGLFTENGPCEVVQLQDGSYGTQSRLWGWDRSSNMLFIDQPTQTGFSYDELVNGSVAFPDEQRYVPPRSSPEGFPSYAFLNGTFATADAYSTQNTSIIAASASWHFLQAFLSAFPQYNPGTHPNNSATEATGINLFVESYGGMFGPAFADFYEMQNSRRSTGNLPGNGTLEIKIASLGIVNGLVDELIQAPWWPKFAYDNSYGIQVIDQTTELNALSDFQASGGCRELTNRCRTSTALLDPLGEGDDTSTNRICSTARQKCERILNIALSTRSPYDIRGVRPYSYSDSAFLEYLNTASVQQSIGAKVNFTMAGTPVFRAFNNSKSIHILPSLCVIVSELILAAGDQARGTQMKSLAGLLSKGIRVAFIYGDA
jgi:carboxypeptidase C (cathepsin A)